jgi:UDP-glucuronate 4-epimerase
MALYLFAEAISQGKPIKVFNNGDLSRDFTYVDDIIEGVVRVMKHIPTEEICHCEHNPQSPCYRVFNIGHSQPVPLMDFISTLEEEIGKKAILEMYPMQQGDVKITYADTSNLEQAVDYKPSTGVKEGIKNFVKWYVSYIS